MYFPWALWENQLCSLSSREAILSWVGRNGRKLSSENVTEVGCSLCLYNFLPLASDRRMINSRWHSALSDPILAQEIHLTVNRNGKLWNHGICGVVGMLCPPSLNLPSFVAGIQMTIWINDYYHRSWFYMPCAMVGGKFIQKQQPDENHCKNSHCLWSAAS